MRFANFTIAPFRKGLWGADTDRLVAFWNRSASDLHGFFPLDRSAFAERIVRSPRFRPERLLLARNGGEIAGLVHFDTVRETPYPHAGVVAMLLVAPEYRNRGLGGALLGAALDALNGEGVPMIDGFGSWPYSPFYATLIDGSERSGVSLGCAGLLRVFEKAGFERARESLVMRCDLTAPSPPPPDSLRGRDGSLRAQKTPRRECTTWLDYVFRGWRLFDYALSDAGGRVLSRAIAGRMEGVSRLTGREEYALFGVNTPEALRGRGWATLHLRRVLDDLRAGGAERVELHVYADNEPAVRLYVKSGFVEIGRTMMLRRTRP